MTNAADRPAPSLGREPAAYMVTPAWRMLGEQILHLAQFGSSVQVICGAEGAGKTTFLRFLRDSAQDLDFFFISVSQSLPPETLFRSVLTQLGLRPNERAGLGELIVALRSFAQSLAATERRVVFAFDDAHRLQASELAALVSVLQGGDEEGFGLHFLLLSEPGLAERIDELQLLDVAVHDVYLPAFTPAEVKSLLARAADIRDETVRLDEGAVQNVWVESGGLPGRALALLHECVVEPEPELDPEPPAVESRKPRALPFLHMAALLLLFCVLVWVVLLRNDDPVELAEEPLSSPLIVEGRSAIPVIVGSEPEPKPEPEPEPAAAVSDPEPVAVINEARPERAVESVPVEQGAGTPVPTTPNNPKLREVERLAEELAVARQPPAPAEATPPPTGQSLPAKAEPPVVASKEGAASSAALALLNAGENQLSKYAQEGYVLQLMATGSLPTLYDFYLSQPNRRNLLVHRAMREGKLLYFLVEGFYADSDSAKAAVRNLPAAQKAGGPWPKRIAVIQTELGKLPGN